MNELKDEARLGSVFSPVRAYEVQCTEAEPEEHCVICWNSFNPPSDDGCSPVRTPCGHLVGDDCLRDWLVVHPETCPLWPHTLRSSTQAPYEDVEGLFGEILRRVCLSSWAASLDSDISRVVCTAFPQADRLLVALQQNTLDEEGGKVLFSLLGKAMVVVHLSRYLLAVLIWKVFSLPVNMFGLSVDILHPYSTTKLMFYLMCCHFIVAWIIVYFLLRFAVRQACSGPPVRVVLIKTNP